MHAIRRSDNAKRPRRWFTSAGAALAILVGFAGARAASPADHLTTPEVVVHLAAMHFIPAALAESTPFGESSTATQPAGSIPSFRAAVR